MESRTNKYLKNQGKFLFIVVALIMLSFGALVITSAWFTDSATSEGSSGTLQFGTVEISADGGNDNEEAVIKIANINNSNSVLMPGSGVSTTVRVKNTGNVDCYYLVSFICTNNILASTYNNDYFYNATNSAVIKSTLDNKLCGALSPNGTQTLNFNLTISTDVTQEDLSSRDAEIKCVVYAVQKANITEPRAYYILQTLKTTQFPESRTIMLFNEDMSWAGDTTSITSGVKLTYTDESKTQFYLDASSISSNTTNATGDDLYFFSSEAYDTSIYTSKYDTTENSYLAKLSTAYNYDLTYDLSNKYIYDTPSHSLNLYPVFLTPNVGDNDSSKNTYVKDTTDYVIYSKDKTQTDGTKFNGHSAIKAVVLPNTITYVTGGCFNNTGLKYLTLPTSNLTKLGFQAFGRTSNLEYVNIPNCIKYFNDDSTTYPGAFALSGLKEVTINGDVEDLYSAFYQCTNLISVTINGDVENLYGTFNQCTSLVNVVINGDIADMTGAFYKCTNLKTVEFGEKCTIISEGYDAFYGATSLTDVTFKNLRSLNSSYTMFRNTAITSIDLGDSMKTLTGKYIFAVMPKLVSVDLGENIETINANGLFQQSSSLKNINFGSALKSLQGEMMIRNTSVTSIQLPTTLEFLGFTVFYDSYNTEKITGSIGIPGKCVITGDSNGPFCENTGITDFYLMDENGNKIKESTLYVERDGVIYKKLGNDQFRLELFPCAYTGQFKIYKEVVEFRRFEIDNARNITKYIVEAGNPVFTTDSYGVLYSKNGTQLRSFPASCGLSSYTVPEGVTEIYILNTKTPLALTVPSTLTSLPGCAFQGSATYASNIVSINSTTEGVADLSNTQIEFVGYKCFEYNKYLKHLILPSTCSRIQSGALLYTSVNEITTYYNGKLELTNIDKTWEYVDSGDMLAYTGYDASTGTYKGITKLHILSTLSQDLYTADSEWNVYISSAGGSNDKPKLTVYADLTN